MLSIADPACHRVQDFARSLGGNWIGSVPVLPEPHCAELCCHQNCINQANSIGGSAVLGYTITQMFDGELHGCLHSVWRSLDGSLIDITPYQDNRLITTFVECPNLKQDSAVSVFSNVGVGLKTDFYVYLLVDPRSSKPFYVGKGKGKRANTHLWDISRSHNQYKESTIHAIRREGLEPEIVYLIEGIPDEDYAYGIENHLIKTLGRKGYERKGILTNVCIDARPPSHRGRTYSDIYGDRAGDQIEKRRRRQKERGGYGPRSHNSTTIEKK